MLRRRSGGQSVVYAVLLLPVLMLILAIVTDIGALQMQKVRLRSALDMAAVDAAQEIDAEHYARTGTLQLDTVRAEAAARRFLVYNLEPLQHQLGGRDVVETVAREADIAIVNEVPARNPFTRVTLERPGVAARMQVPIKTGLLHLIAIRDTVTLTIAVDAEIKR